MKIAHLKALALSSLALASTAGAQSTYIAEFIPTLYTSSSGPAYMEQDYVPHPGGGITFWGWASADTGVLRAFGAGTQGGIWNGPQDTARARHRITDVVFSAPPGVATTDVFLRMTLSGFQYTYSPISRASLTLAMGPPAALEYGTYFRVETSTGTSIDPTGLLFGTNIENGPVVITGGPWTVPTNTPVTFEVSLSASGYGAQGGGASIQATLALGDGFVDLGSSYPVFVLQPGIRVDAPSAGIVDNMWTPPTEAGFRFCEPLVPNSSGLVARIAATGSNELAANDLELVVTGLPTTGTTALLVNSRSALVELTNPGGSDGRLCIASLTMGRHSQQIYMGTSGGFRALLDLNALPHPGGATAVLVGETWYWQCWYRDPQAGPGRSNFSAALGVTFE